MAAPCRAAGVVWKTPSFFCRGRKAPSPRTALSRACPVRAPPLTARPTVLLLRPAVLWSGSLFLCCVGGGGVGVRVWRGGSRRRPMDGQHPIPLPSGTGVGAARREGDRVDGVRGTPACLGTEPGPAESRTRPRSPSGVSRRTLQCLSRRRRSLSPREDFVTCTVQYIRLQPGLFCQPTNPASRTVRTHFRLCTVQHGRANPRYACCSRDILQPTNGQQPTVLYKLNRCVIGGPLDLAQSRGPGDETALDPPLRRPVRDTPSPSPSSCAQLPAAPPRRGAWCHFGV